MLSSCEDGVVEIGVIEQDGPAQVTVPDSAKAGESAVVKLVTYGSGCVSFQDTEINIAADGAEIIPYDLRREGNCTQIQLQISHDAIVRFDSAGAKTIKITGRKKYFGGGQFVDEVIERSFSMTVD